MTYKTKYFSKSSEYDVHEEFEEWLAETSTGKIKIVSHSLSSVGSLTSAETWCISVLYIEDD